MTGTAGSAKAGRRVFLVGSPRSRTTVAQGVLSQACGLVTISTNWWLTSSGTRLLNGPEGEPREAVRPFAQRRVAGRLAEIGIELLEGFRVEEALDRLAAASGAMGWLEKTPLHVLALEEIQAEVPGARVLHLIRDPGEVVASLLRRAAANPQMRGAAWQGVQAHCEAIWRECVRATSEQYGKVNHLVLDAGVFVADPEAIAKRVAGFLDVAYRASEDAARIAQASIAEPSERPWKRDAAGPVREFVYQDSVALVPLEPETVQVWQHARTLLDVAHTEAGE